MVTFPVEETSHKGGNQTIVCFAYDEDLYQMYDFYTARYKEISFEEFMKLGYEYFSIKLRSIPETEPLHTIIKSRTINIGKIKDKEERKYWRELKRANAIPDIYKSNEEIDREMKQTLKSMGGIN
jgi:hypothetical protein